METVRNNLIKYLETKNFQILKSKRSNEIFILTLNINCWIQIKYWSSINYQYDQKLKLYLVHKNGKIVRFIHRSRYNIDQIKILKLNEDEINNIRNEIKIYELTFLERQILLIIDRILYGIYRTPSNELVIEKKLINTIAGVSVILKNKQIHKKYIIPTLLRLKDKYYNNLSSVIHIIELQNIIINYLIHPQNI